MVQVCCSISHEDNEFCKINGLNKSILLQSKIQEMREKLTNSKEDKKEEMV